MTNITKQNWKAAFFGRCPACGGKAFKDIVKIADHCKTCGTDLKKYETADGPAFFAISGVGTLTGIGAGIYEILAEPPLWHHLLIWPPLALIGSIIIIRISKTLMIAHQMELATRKVHEG